MKCVSFWPKVVATVNVRRCISCGKVIKHKHAAQRRCTECGYRPNRYKNERARYAEAKK